MNGGNFMKIIAETKFEMNEKVLWESEEVEIVGVSAWTNGHDTLIYYLIDTGYCVENDVHESKLSKI